MFYLIPNLGGDCVPIYWHLQNEKQIGGSYGRTMNGFGYESKAEKRRLGYLYDSTTHSMVLVTDNAFDARSVKALIDSITVSEEFAHDHRFLATDASERSRPSFVNQEPQVYLSTV
jgi:hypothetical protein